MQLLLFLLLSFIILAAAYVVFGRMLARIFALNDEKLTPAHRQRDGLDFEPARMTYLLPQHFSAIAAAGPIVGPILAGVYFGWGPAWLWILFGSILIGGIHDFTALVASVRHKGRSVAEVVRRYMNPRAYVLFLLFIWSALIYVIIAFTDVTAGTFAKKAAEDETASGAAVASSSILYLGLAVLMGLALRWLKVGPIKAKLIFLPLVVVVILIGPHIPLDLTPITGEGQLQRVWGFILLGYCFVAAMVPVWSLLQPRGELGGYFLYTVMIVAVLGIVIGAFTGQAHIEQDFFRGWSTESSLGGALPLFPILFITVACGACSGFHSIVASGTTSKQLDRESDAKPVAYGGMLLEGFLACLSLATLMVISGSVAGKSPDSIFAAGIADFGTLIVAPLIAAGVPVREYLFQFAMLCFATFVFDTLDACTRLARYIFMELMGWKTRAQAVVATAASLAIPAFVVALPYFEVGGVAQPLWKSFWAIFGSSNQLLAALTLLGVTVWMARRQMPFYLTLGPAIFMMAMTIWSLVLQAQPYIALFEKRLPIAPIQHVQFAIVLSLIGLSAWLIGEAVLTWRSSVRPPESEIEGPDSATAAV